MHVGALATDFTSSSFKMREKLFLDKERMYSFFNQLPDTSPIREIVALCTCNRIELYYVCTDHHQAKEWLTAYLAGFHGMEIDVLRGALTNYTCEAAVRHLFRVASGVESLVFGEHEILGQIREAYDFCCSQSRTDSFLNRLFQQAIATGKLIRSKTDAGRGALSVSSIAIEKISELYNDDFTQLKVLIVGTGKMGLKALKRLVQMKPSYIGISNRTDEKAERISQEFSVHYVPYNDLQGAIPGCNCIISATSAPQPVIRKEMLMGVHRTDSNPMVIIDIGMPSNVECSVTELENVKLICVDDLKSAAEHHLMKRKGDIDAIERLIDEQVNEFTRWYRFKSGCECNE